MERQRGGATIVRRQRLLYRSAREFASGPRHSAAPDGVSQQVERAIDVGNVSMAGMIRATIARSPMALLTTTSSSRRMIQWLSASTANAVAASDMNWPTWLWGSRLFSTDAHG